jgi:hypothetical protein
MSLEMKIKGLKMFSKNQKKRNKEGEKKEKKEKGRGL